MTQRGRRLLVLLLFIGAGWFAFKLRDDIRHVRQRQCINQLRDIEGAKEQFALEHENAAPAAISELVPGYISSLTFCPSGGTYTLGDLQASVHCSLDQHAVDWVHP